MTTPGRPLIFWEQQGKYHSGTLSCGVIMSAFSLTLQQKQLGTYFLTYYRLVKNNIHAKCATIMMFKVIGDEINYLCFTQIWTVNKD